MRFEFPLKPLILLVKEDFKENSKEKIKANHQLFFSTLPLFLKQF